MLKQLNYEKQPKFAYGFDVAAVFLSTNLTIAGQVWVNKKVKVTWYFDLILYIFGLLSVQMG